MGQYTETQLPQWIARKVLKKPHMFDWKLLQEQMKDTILLAVLSPKGMQCDLCHRFLTAHSRTSVGKSKPTVALDGRMKALLNTTRSTISWKVIVDCAAPHSIRSC